MKRPEQQIQRAVFEHFRIRAAPGVLAWHTPNGGYRRKTEAAILRGLGVVGGIPDVLVVKDGRLFALELKPEGGRLTESQERTLIALRDAGAAATHAHGIDQALRILEGWGVLKGRADTRGKA
jgi:hypothetical protein